MLLEIKLNFKGTSSHDRVVVNQIQGLSPNQLAACSLRLVTFTEHLR